MAVVSRPDLPSTPQPPPNSINVNSLGYYLDGWADLVEGMGEKAEQVTEKVFDELSKRKMPDIDIRRKDGYVSLVSSEKRPYTISTTSPGATTAVRIGQYGQDLFVSWRTFIRPVFNQTTLLVTGAIAAGLGFYIGGTQHSTDWLGNSYSSFSLWNWIFTSVVIFIIEAVILTAAGKIFKGNTFAYFFIEPNLFDADDITAMGFSAHKSILRSLDSAGIDISKLRLKQDFQGGRRNERI